MSADDSIEDLFVALRVLSKITPNEKIATRSNEVLIDNGGWSALKWLTRWWRDEGNKVNIERSRRIFAAMSAHVSSSIDVYEAYSRLAAASTSGGGSGGGGCENESSNASHDMEAKIEQTRRFIERALEALEAASRGVSNLKQTYKNDVNIESRIEELNHTVDTLVSATRRRLVVAAGAAAPQTPPIAQRQSQSPQQQQQHVISHPPPRHPVYSLGNRSGTGSDDE